METRTRVNIPGRFKKETTPNTICFIDKIGSFLPDLKEAAQQAGLTVTTVDGIVNPEAIEKNEFIWCSWADDLACHYSKYRWPGKFVVQLRSYEAYVPQFLQHLQARHIDRLVYVADHILEHFQAASPSFKLLPTSILPTCIDPVKWEWPDKEKKDTKQVLFVGRHCTPKNSELLPILAASFPDHNFVALGPFHDPRLKPFLEHHNRKLQNLILVNNETGEWWSEDPREVMWESSHILSISTHESTHKALMEGMLMGCKPLVLNRPGLWIDPVRSFTSFQEFEADLMGDWEPKAYRDYITTMRHINIHHQCFKSIIQGMRHADDSD